MTTKEYTLSLGRNHKLRRKPYSESEDCDYDTDTSGDTRNCDVLSRYVHITQGLIETLGSMVIFDENQGVSDLSKYEFLAQYMSNSSSF